MKTITVDHPLVKHKLGKLRDIATDPVHFRQLAGEIAGLLAFEATRDLPTEPMTVQTWAGPLQVEHVRGEDLPWCRSCAPASVSCPACRRCCRRPRSA